MSDDRRLRHLLLTALAVLGAWGVWTIAAPTRSFHPSGLPCPACHLGGSPLKPEQAHLLRFSQEKLCGVCHPKATQMSHPSGFAPKQKVSADYPLDWKGDLTCSSCHEVHSDKPGHMRGNKRGREFCQACHDNQFFARMRDQGNSVMLSGHLDAGKPAALVTLDSYSQQCLTCHGNSADSNYTRVDSNRVVRHGAASSVNHPIAVRYAEAERAGGYKPMAQVSKRIMLPNGLVSCISCHEGYSKVHGKLVSTSGSGLCTECHDLL